MNHRSSSQSPGLRPTRARSLLLLAAAAIAAAVGCLFAVDDKQDEHKSGAPSAQSTAPASTGAELTRGEFNARLSAQQPLAQQPPQQQRRYYDTWVGALQRSQATQQAILEQLRAQRDALATSDAKRAAIEEHIAAGEKQLAARADQLASYQAKAGELREP